MSFQRRIFLTLTGLTLLPLVVFYLSSLKQFSQSLTKEMENETLLASTALNHEVEDLLHPGMAGLKLLSELPFLHEQLLEDWDKDSGLRNLLLQFQKTYPHFLELRVLKGGQEPSWFSSTWHLRVTRKPEERTLSRLKESVGSYMGSIRPSSLLSEVPELPVGVVFEGETGQKHLLEGAIDLREFFHRIDVIASGWQKDDHLRALVLLGQERQVLYRTRNAPAEWEASGQFEIRSQELASLPGYHLNLLIPKSEMSLPIQRLREQVGALGILLACLASLSGFWLVRRLTSPVRNLAEAAKEVAQGNLNPHLEPGFDDELGELARGFDFMCDSLKFRQEQVEELRNKLQKSVDDLERQVRDRTAELFERYEEQKQLSRMLTHDLGNMIGSVQLGLSNLKQEDSSQKGVESLVQVARETSSFLNRFRELMAVEEGRIEARMEWVDVAEITEDLELLYANRLDDKELHLEIRLEENLKIHVDREWFLLSVLSNLMSNAIKFSHPGSRIVWSAYSRDSDVILSLMDFGVGMSEEECEKALHAGKSLVRSGTQGEKGTGFGLPMVSRWVQFFQGSLKLSPNPVGGLEVCLRLPGRAE